MLANAAGPTRGLGGPGGDVELADLDPPQLATHLGRVERAGTEVLRRLRAARDPVREALPRRRALISGRDVAGEEAVARSDRGDRLEWRRRDLVTASLGPLADDGDAARLAGDHRLPGAHLDQSLDAEREVVGVVELVADRLLGLARVWGDDRGLGL